MVNAETQKLEPAQAPPIEVANDLHGEDDASLRKPSWVGMKPPENARCARCGSADVSARPTFSSGAGVAWRPNADDVFCRRCSFQGQPRFEPRDEAPGETRSGR
jgi:hypothetical protein